MFIFEHKMKTYNFHIVSFIVGKKALTRAKDMAGVRWFFFFTCNWFIKSYISWFPHSRKLCRHFHHITLSSLSVTGFHTPTFNVVHWSHGRSCCHVTLLFLTVLPKWRYLLANSKYSKAAVAAITALLVILVEKVAELVLVLLATATGIKDVFC